MIFIGKTVHALALSVLRYVSPEIAAARLANTMVIPPFWGTKDITQLLKLDEEKVIAEALKNPAEHNKPGRRRVKKATAESMRAAMDGPVYSQDEPGKKPWPTATSVATTVKKGLERFWNSTAQKVDDKCLPQLMIDKLGLKAETVLQWVKDIWEDIYHGRAAWLPHDAYLKMLYLRGQEGEGDERAFGFYDVIMFDEAQDANPCMATIVLRQQRKEFNPAGLIVVGDPYQRIYGFRGAGNEAFDEEKFPADITRYLTWSFRFGDSVSSVANTILRVLGEPVSVNGVRRTDHLSASLPPSSDHSHYPDAPFTVVFRKNITLIEFAISFSIRNPIRKLHLRIQRTFQKSVLFTTLRDAFALYHSNRAAPSGALRGWKSWIDLRAHVEAEDEHHESPILTLVVQLEPHLADPAFLEDLTMLEGNVLDDAAAADADVVLITAHQAKGLEWDNVMVADDFRPEFEARHRARHSRFLREEACTLYVAVTRARKRLVLSDQVKAWVAGDRGWNRFFFAVGVDGCGVCALREGREMEIEEEAALRAVVVMQESLLEQADGGPRSSALTCVLDGRREDLWEGFDLASGMPRLVEALTAEGMKESKMMWCERKAWDEVWGEWCKSETERVQRWIEAPPWHVWRQMLEA